MAEKKINVLGMDVFMTAAIKRSYQNVKPLINKRQKAEQKMQDAQREIDMINEQIDAMDIFAKTTSKKACGFELTSEQCMHFIEHPEEFEKFKAAQNPLFEVPAGTAAGSDFDIDNAPAPEPMYDENIGEENTAAAELAWN